MFCNLTLVYCKKGEHVRNSKIISVKNGSVLIWSKVISWYRNNWRWNGLHQGIELKEEWELNYCIFLLRMLNDRSGIIWSAYKFQIPLMYQAFCLFYKRKLFPNNHQCYTCHNYCQCEVLDKRWFLLMLGQGDFPWISLDKIDPSVWYKSYYLIADII